MSHKAHLLSCALRCSSKLRKIQSLENFVSMAIQGTLVPIFTKHTLFLYFYIFFIFQNFYFYFYEKLNKEKKNMLNKAKHKTRCKCMKHDSKSIRNQAKESPTPDRKN